MASLNPHLLEMLVCPVTRSSLKLKGDWLISEAAQLAYPIRNSIPIMLVEEAQPLEKIKGKDYE